MTVRHLSILGNSLTLGDGWLKYEHYQLQFYSPEQWTSFIHLCICWKFCSVWLFSLIVLIFVSGPFPPVNWIKDLIEDLRFCCFLPPLLVSSPNLGLCPDRALIEHSWAAVSQSIKTYQFKTSLDRYMQCVDWELLVHLLRAAEGPLSKTLNSCTAPYWQPLL